MRFFSSSVWDSSIALTLHKALSPLLTPQISVSPSLAHSRPLHYCHSPIVTQSGDRIPPLLEVTCALFQVTQCPWLEEQDAG